MNIRILFNSIVFLNIFGIVVEGQVEDPSIFLGGLLANYIPKNTRYYTIVNGVPLVESEDKEPNNDDILSQISSLLPPYIANSPIMNQVLASDANSFPNSWAPMLSELPTKPNTDNSQDQLAISRRHAQDGYRFSIAQEHRPLESKIITLQDIQPPWAPSEFQLGTSMNF